MLDISFRSELPGKAVVYLDGEDARVFNHLLTKLGSEERIQDAMILYGFLAHARDGKVKVTREALFDVISNFNELVGTTYEQFEKLLEVE